MTTAGTGNTGILPDIKIRFIDGTFSQYSFSSLSKIMPYVEDMYSLCKDTFIYLDFVPSKDLFECIIEYHSLEPPLTMSTDPLSHPFLHRIPDHTLPTLIHISKILGSSFYNVLVQYFANRLTQGDLLLTTSDPHTPEDLQKMLYENTAFTFTAKN